MKPLVSICIPTLGREEKLARCIASIEEHTSDWPYEAIVRFDQFGPQRKGCPRMLAECVAQSRGEYVAFLGNDTIVKPGWLRIAMECMANTFPDGVGLAGFADNYWPDGRCLHWVASKKLLPILGGEYFHSGYSHVGCDDELIARCIMTGCYVHCPDAMVDHDHFVSGAAVDEVYRVAWQEEAVARDRQLLAARAERMGFAPWLPR
jgi:glycosyltransferase involved in cell wall biosynthesis